MNDTLMKALILAALFGAVMIAVDTVVGWLARSRTEGRAINLRLKLIKQGRTTGEALTLLKRSDSALPEGLPDPLLRVGQQFERMLMTAQVTMPTPRLMLILLLAPCVLLFAMLLFMVATGIPVGFGRVLLLGTFSIVLGLFIPVLVLQVRANRMRKKMQDQFPIALDVFVRGLRAGHPVSAALDLLTVELPDPIGSQFGMVVDEVTYGAELRDALHSMAERWDLNDMRMFVVSLSVQNETGGNLAEILRESVEGDPRPPVDDAQGPRFVERGPHDRHHLDGAANHGLHRVVHAQSAFLSRRRRRSGFCPGLCGVDPPLHHRLRRDPSHGRHQGLER